MREVILGIIQGLTEFLPISSSGHLVIGQHILPGSVSTEEDVLLDILLHFATLLVVLMYYRRDIVMILQDLFTLGRRSQEPLTEPEAQLRRKMPWLILVGTLPTGLVGVALKLSDRVETLFSSLPLIGVALLVTGILLFFSDTVQHRAPKTDISYRDALIIGTVQGIAVLPGISRSGSTISTSILRGIDRPLAAKFSFLLSIPAILGAVVLEGKDIVHLSQSPHLLPYAAGMLAAFVAGYAAIVGLLRLVMKRQLRWFSFYCWVVGLGVLGYSLTGL
jgi:undecaprenyl-diphosphatase